MINHDFLISFQVKQVLSNLSVKLQYYGLDLQHLLWIFINVAFGGLSYNLQHLLHNTLLTEYIFGVKTWIMFGDCAISSLSLSFMLMLVYICFNLSKSFCKAPLA